MSDVAILTKGLTKHFGELQAVKGIDLSVPGGRDHQSARAQRRRQEHHHLYARLPAAPDVRAMPGSWATRSCTSRWRSSARSASCRRTSPSMPT